jgi:hypothetical protein
MLSGLIGIGISVMNSQRVVDGQTVGFTTGIWLGIAMAALGALVGLGLLLRIEIVRGVVNFFCALQLLRGLLGLAGTLLGMMFVGPYAIIYLLLNVIDISTAAFMIYLIGETDKSAPNI